MFKDLPRQIPHYTAKRAVTAETPASDAATLHNEITSTYAYVLTFQAAPKQETATRLGCTLVLTPDSAPDVGNSGDQQ